MLTLSHISKRYQQKQVLADISLSLTAGDIICLLGASGCGKSTLLRIVAGLIQPDGGAVNISPSQCAMVFQEPRLLPWLTVAENLALALPFWQSKKDRQATIIEALQQVQLGDSYSLLPHELSGGMAQRVGIARALLQKPQVLLMDEPFAALDAITRAEQQQLLIELITDRQISCLFVTHDINEAMTIGHQILVINQGRVVVDHHHRNDILPSELKQQILTHLQTADD
ncbi:ABC transporter ATP-binding protein [Budvicia diplopodorum]|uniref:ABC transporter ATP-binding protein n=1 Tax=Budvicia diplopodorum TaxID=1119056 RepID=UPI001356CA93|nr:ABC transporter ATP-binding protein [Budvicia diplopodorum]